MQKKPSKAVQARRERKRMQILVAAASTFNSKGFHNTTIDDLCDILKLSKPTVYYYVKDKEALLFECSRVATTDLHAAIRKARDEGRNGWQRLKNIFVAYAEIMSTDFGKCLILTSRSDMSSDSSERLWEGRRRLNAEVREVIEQGITDGSIRPCDPKFVSYALFGSFNWIAHWYDETGEQTPKEIAEAFFDIYHSGIAARGVEENVQDRPMSESLSH
jgi:AcrR family transcriptional regulator